MYNINKQIKILCIYEWKLFVYKMGIPNGLGLVYSDTASTSLSIALERLQCSYQQILCFFEYHIFNKYSVTTIFTT